MRQRQRQRAAAAAAASSAAEAKIGVILPDTESSVRWETADRPALEAAFKDAGVDYDIQNAQGDADKMAQIADSMIASGVTVLAIVNLDNASGAAIEEKAKNQGVATIDYDRLTLGGSADVLRLVRQREGRRAPGRGSPELPRPGQEGEHRLPQRLARRLQRDRRSPRARTRSSTRTRTTRRSPSRPFPDWDNEQAGTIFEQMYTQQKGKIDGVLAANDGLGGAAIAILDKNGVAGKVPVTGQDATVQGLQNILAGTQCMTVYKSAKQEAGALADLAIGLAKGEKGETNGTSRTPRATATSRRCCSTRSRSPRTTSRTSSTTVGQTAAEVCKGYEKQCAAAGIS